MVKVRLVLAWLALLLACKKNPDTIQPPSSAIQPDSLRLNQFQFLASHNSYRLKTDPDIFNVLITIQALLPNDYKPSELDYSHETFEKQLDEYGLRAFEIDIYHDPEGGRYYNRIGNGLANKPFESGIPELLQPGMKVLHIVDIDYNSHYYTLKSNLAALKAWSDAHPNHLPIIIQIEPKEQTVADVITQFNYTTAPKFTPGALDSLDEEIRSTLGSNRVIKPDDIRGNESSLWTAIQQKGWPKLKDCRGKFLFVIDGNSTQINHYRAGHSGLQGRMMFVFTEPNTPESGFIILNDPISQFNLIQQRVREGYLVRTRADSGTEQARNGDTTARYHAFTSGAQFVSTDYYRPDPRSFTPGSGWSNYSVSLPGGYRSLRPNPVLLPNQNWNLRIE
ncbi:MAG: phosphatidylinositol-specific phospholipase C1-like protein [Bacteroidia bacterium]|nr:phosphatidylinositol-specific phospholipase C1-like protein [Bacteroidia bacterium]